jgi:hypothetical protein
MSAELIPWTPIEMLENVRGKEIISAWITQIEKDCGFLLDLKKDEFIQESSILNWANELNLYWDTLSSEKRKTILYSTDVPDSMLSHEKEIGMAILYRTLQKVVTRFRFSGKL